MKQVINLAVTLMITTGFPAWSTTFSYASEAMQQVSTENAIHLRGLIQEVRAKELVLVVRPLKGRHVVIEMDVDTMTEGFERIEELEKKQQVEVWYTIQGETNRAVKIEKLLDLGC